MYQLNQHLDELPESVMRMVFYSGMRTQSRRTMPAPIKLLETRWGWFIQFMRWKVKTETTIPISELSKVIQEQQNYIRQNLNENYEYLFCQNSSSS